MSVEVLVPVLTTRLQAALPPISSDKFPERFGLLTMIVLGETLYGVIRSVTAANEGGDLGLATLLQSVLGLAIGFALWWLYYDLVGRRPTRPSFTPALVWVYLHLVMLAAIVLVGVALTEVIASEGTALDAAVRTLLLLVVAGTLLSIAAIEYTLDRTGPTRRPGRETLVLAGPAAVLVGLAAVPPRLGATGTIAVCLLALAVPAIASATSSSPAPGEPLPSHDG